MVLSQQIFHQKVGGGKMDLWTIETLRSVTNNFETLTVSQQQQFQNYMNSSFPPVVFNNHLNYRRLALKNSNSARNNLIQSHQQFPNFTDWKAVSSSPKSLENHALIFTAGGEGERLRLSLLKLGVDEQELENFTKATFKLPDFYKKYGTLHVNLSMIASFCDKYEIDIPVIVTTGPKGSITARVIPEILDEYSNFGLKNVKIIEQEERIHFSMEEKVVWQMSESGPVPVTHPDETGGPLMKLKQTDQSGSSILDWLEELNCTRSIVVQATALYDLSLLPLMAEALKGHDCLAVGILRDSFSPNDPFGTFVTLLNGTSSKTMILEQDVRNDFTRELKDQSGRYFLPFNTGFYAFENSLLKNNSLPHFATPPKEIYPDLPRSPKIGYAATDIVPLANNPIILTIKTDMFGVLKTSDDLKTLSELGKKYGLDKMCKERESFNKKGIFSE